MRITSSLLLASSALISSAPSVFAQDAQKPLLSSWFEKAKSYVGNGIPSPVEASAAAVASATITELTTSNWKSELRTRAGEASPQNWLIQVTGGNKTCAGKCEGLDANFNKTAALLSATPGGPHLGRINCEKTPALCSILFTGPPVLWYLQIPGPEAADQSRAPTPIYVKGLNGTEAGLTSVQDMVDFHSKKTYLERTPVESFMHPFDGILSQYGLNVPFGYVIYALSVVPSWGVMLLVSFATRNMMSKRMQQQGQGNVPTGGPAAGPAAAKKSN